jgi:hypothetical protein
MENEFIGPDTNPNGSTFVSLSKTSKRPPTTETAPDEAVNLVSLFKEEELKKIGERVWELYVADAKSCGPRMKKIRDMIEWYTLQTTQKTWPWHKAANIRLPALTYPMLQVQARLYDMIWPENGKVIYSAPSTTADVARAEATEKFGNSYIRTEMPEMEQGLDDTIGQVALCGSGFRRTYWDPHEKRVRSDWIPIEDFVCAHTHRSQDPSMRDVPRYTLVHHMTLADLETYGDSGVFENVEGLKLEDHASDAEASTEIKDIRAKLDGVSATRMDDRDPDKSRMVLEQHCRWRLPDSKGKHPAFDGKHHYVIITIDDPTKRVLRIVLREEDDPRDAKRFNKETAKIKEWEAIASGAGQQQAPMIDPATGMMLPAPPPIQPPPPPFGFNKVGMPNLPEPARKRQVCFFTHYRAFPSEGFYGLGFGDFIAPIAKAASTLLNQHIDGVTLRNARPGFISRQMRGPRGAINVSPGQLEEVDAPPEVIAKGIVWLDPPMNDPTTMPLIKLQLEMADKVGGSADLMSGQTSGANRTAKEISILNSQLMKQISVLGRRIKGAFRHELDKIWRCWGIFLPEEPEDMPVVDPATGKPESLPISRQMFVPDARITPACDPRMKFEKVEEAQQKFGVVMNNPMLQQNPMAMYEATAEVLRAMDAEQILAALPRPEPPQPPPPPQAKPHWAEEAGWLREQDTPVHPDDNDDEHMQMHQAFLQSPAAQMMSKTGRDMAERHLRFHAAQALEKRAQKLEPQGPPQMGPPGMGPPGGPPGPQMGPPPGGPPPGGGGPPGGPMPGGMGPPPMGPMGGGPPPNGAPGPMGGM